MFAASSPATHPYGRYVSGDRGTLTAEQQLGLRIFRRKGNGAACHVRPNFTDEKLHNTGVAWHDGSLVARRMLSSHPESLLGDP
ncbi:MAG: hypothetical protein R2762_22165 [Bryobacteraceae bacterium]